MDTHLRAGIAVFNAGEYHAAHDAWEDPWLGLDSDTRAERFLHGLIQYTASVSHASDRNWDGAVGLARSAREYLGTLPGTYRGVNVGEIRAYLAELADDPAILEREPPPRLSHEGVELSLSDLGFEATAVAADCLAESRGETELIEQAVAFARADLGGTSEPLRGETGSPFVPLVFDYVREPDNRGIIVQRMRQHVDRRRAREDDVASLFDEREREQ